MTVLNFPSSPARLATGMDDAVGLARALHTMLRDASESGGMAPDLAQIGLDAMRRLMQRLVHAAEAQPGLNDLCLEADRLLGQASIAFLRATATVQRQDERLPPTEDFYSDYLPPMTQAVSVLARVSQRLRVIEKIEAGAAEFRHLRPVH